MGAASWTAAEAKAKFSELVDKARLDGPQMITRRGRPTAVLVSVEVWDRRTRRKGSLAAFFADSPFVGAGVDLERAEESWREVEI